MSTIHEYAEIGSLEPTHDDRLLRQLISRYGTSSRNKRLVRRNAYRRVLVTGPLGEVQSEPDAIIEDEDVIIQVQSKFRRRSARIVSRCKFHSGGRVSEKAEEIRQIFVAGVVLQPQESVPEALALLREHGVHERRRGVILAETLHVNGELRSELRQRLQEFIEGNRDSNDPEDLVAVGSAIRKLLAMSDLDDLQSASVILRPSPRMSLPIEVELEVSKMIVRKLVANSNTLTPPNEKLSDLLFQIVETYANDRMLPRDKYGATTLNAIIASVLLHSNRLDSIHRTLGQLSAPWFVRAIARRCRKLEREIDRNQAGQPCPAVAALQEFEASLSAI